MTSNINIKWKLQLQITKKKINFKSLVWNLMFQNFADTKVLKSIFYYFAVQSDKVSLEYKCLRMQS